jgi:hypothetical protein
MQHLITRFILNANISPIYPLTTNNSGLPQAFEIYASNSSPIIQLTREVCDQLFKAGFLKEQLSSDKALKFFENKFLLPSEISDSSSKLALIVTKIAQSHNEFCQQKTNPFTENQVDKKIRILKYQKTSKQRLINFAFKALTKQDKNIARRIIAYSFILLSEKENSSHLFFRNIRCQFYKALFEFIQLKEINSDYTIEDRTQLANAINHIGKSKKITYVSDGRPNEEEIRENSIKKQCLEASKESENKKDFDIQQDRVEIEKKLLNNLENQMNDTEHEILEILNSYLNKNEIIEFTSKTEKFMCNYISNKIINKAKAFIINEILNETEKAKTFEIIQLKLNNLGIIFDNKYLLNKDNDYLLEFRQFIYSIESIDNKDINTPS